MRQPQRIARMRRCGSALQGRMHDAGTMARQRHRRDLVGLNSAALFRAPHVRQHGLLFPKANSRCAVPSLLPRLTLHRPSASSWRPQLAMAVVAYL